MLNSQFYPVDSGTVKNRSENQSDISSNKPESLVLNSSSTTDNNNNNDKMLPESQIRMISGTNYLLNEDSESKHSVKPDKMQSSKSDANEDNKKNNSKGNDKSSNNFSSNTKGADTSNQKNKKVNKSKNKNKDQSNLNPGTKSSFSNPPMVYSQPYAQYQQTSMPLYSQINNNPNMNINMMNQQYNQVPYIYSNNLHSTPSIGKFTRLNSIVEDPMYAIGSSRRGSILPAAELNPNLNSSMDLLSSNGFLSTTSNVPNPVSASNSNIFNSVYPQGSMSFALGSGMYPRSPYDQSASNQLSTYFDPSLYGDIPSKESPSSRNSILPPNQQQFVQPFASDLLISTRRPSEQLDPFIAPTAKATSQSTSKPVAGAATRCSTNSTSISGGAASNASANSVIGANTSVTGGGTSSSTGSISTIPPNPANSRSQSQFQHQMYSLISQPGASNSRQNSFFLRRFPSLAHSSEFSTSDIDSFLKRESLPKYDSSELLDPLQTSNNPSHGNQKNKSNHKKSGSINNDGPFMTGNSRNGSVFQLPLPSRTSTGSINQLLGIGPNGSISSTQLHNDAEQQPVSHMQNTSYAPSEQQQSNSLLHNIKQPHPFTLQHQVYPHLFLQQQQQYQQLQQYQLAMQQRQALHPSMQTQLQSASQIEQLAEKKQSSPSENEENKNSNADDIGDEGAEGADDFGVTSVKNAANPKKGIKRKTIRKRNTREPKLKKAKISTETSQSLNDSDEKDLIDPNSSLKTDDGRPKIGATKVDQLMLVIEARKKGIQGNIKQTEDGKIVESNGTEEHEILPNPVELVGGVEKTTSRSGKTHECKYCKKKFTQATHLEVHLRSHMGVKPYKCDYCGKRFTQGGNLRTHMRLHTGEKPFKCEICFKSFSRKGNLQAHLSTHDKNKPFVCKFDGCNKGFAQLGNLKVHQNKFHLDKINELFDRLAKLGEDGETIADLPPEERELMDYFAGLYKNLNRGIKGRGRTKETPDEE